MEMSWILFNRKLHKVIIQFFILLKGCNLTGVGAKKSQISNTLTLTSCEGIANIILEKTKCSFVLITTSPLLSVLYISGRNQFVFIESRFRKCHRDS